MRYTAGVAAMAAALALAPACSQTSGQIPGPVDGEPRIRLGAAPSGQRTVDRRGTAGRGPRPSRTDSAGTRRVAGVAARPRLQHRPDLDGPPARDRNLRRARRRVALHAAVSLRSRSALRGRFRSLVPAIRATRCRACAVAPAQYDDRNSGPGPYGVNPGSRGLSDGSRGAGEPPPVVYRLFRADGSGRRRLAHTPARRARSRTCRCVSASGGRSVERGPHAVHRSVRPRARQARHPSERGVGPPARGGPDIHARDRCRLARRRRAAPRRAVPPRVPGGAAPRACPRSRRLAAGDTGPRDAGSARGELPLPHSTTACCTARCGWRPGPGSRWMETIRVEEAETRWVFTPRTPWEAGLYQLVAAETLEDVAGNRIGRPFEVDGTGATGSQRARGAVLPFQIHRSNAAR